MTTVTSLDGRPQDWLTGGMALLALALAPQIRFLIAADHSVRAIESLLTSIYDKNRL